MKQSTASTAQAPVGKPVHFLHPLTVIIIGVSAWVAAWAISWPLLHAAIIALGWLAGIAGSRSLAVPATSIALSIPAGLSMLLVHAPHGEHQIAPLLTSDGLVTAGELALRFCALMTALLAAMANVHIPDLLKALQHLGLHHSVVYVLGASLQLLPQASALISEVATANRLARRKVTLTTVIPHMIIPVITRLLTRGADRGIALQGMGYDAPGRRTVLYPVRAHRWEILLRLTFPAAAIGLVVLAWI